MTDKQKTEEFQLDIATLMNSPLPYVGVEHVMVAAMNGIITLNFIQLDYGRIAYVRDNKMEGSNSDPENAKVVARIRMTTDTFKRALGAMNSVGHRMGLTVTAAEEDAEGDEDGQE